MLRWTYLGLAEVRQKQRENASLMFSSGLKEEEEEEDKV